MKQSFSCNLIPGLLYIPNYINPEVEQELINIIDEQIWITDLKRRVQHYGYKYDYKKRALLGAVYLGTLPEWAINIASRLYENKLMEILPDQVIINEYQPGQGIANHIDCITCFGSTVISLSLGSSCVMNLTKKEPLIKIPFLLEPCSLVVFQGEARYEWQHGIAARQKDKYQGREIVRQRRISMTFRKVI
jgi:alkylated DNA repair dioxygenase AlkB